MIRQPLVRMNPAVGQAILDGLVKLRAMKRLWRSAGMDPVMDAGDAGDAGFFPVLLYRNGGADGGGSLSPAYASWTYDLYALRDTGYEHKLNLSGPIGPTCGRCRSLMDPVTQASNSSVGSAYYAADGTIRLFDCPEKYTQSDCVAVVVGS